MTEASPKDSGDRSAQGPLAGSGDWFVGGAYMRMALVTATALMAFKFYGYWLTGSSAILSDALESIINVVAAGFSLWSILFSSRPPDDCHPYGHGKIEFFSAGFEGALIILAAVGIFVEGLKQILNPQPLPNLENGLGILVAAGVANLALGLTLIRAGKRLKSIAVEAHGRHVLSDVYSSAGVLIGLLLVYFTRWYVLDGVVACIAGVNILVMAVALVRRAFVGLMDASDPALLDEISALLARHRKDLWIDAHRLRAWRSGPRVHVDFHLILPRDLPLAEGHREVKDLEAIFERHFDGQAEVLIHLDPCSDPECPVCRQEPCDLRSEENRGTTSWRRQALVGDSDRGAEQERLSGGESGRA